MAATMHEPEHAGAGTQPDAPCQRRRWLSRFPLYVGLFSVAVWLLPPLIATTPLRNVVLKMARSELPGGMTVGSASLSWTEPVQLHDVTVADTSGREVLHVESITSEQTLWQLATERLSKGLFHVFRPRLTLTIRERSRNLEPALARLTQGRSRAGKGYTLDLSNGEVVIVDESGAVLTTIDQVAVSFHKPAVADEPGRLRLTGRVAEPDTQGAVTIEADWTGTDFVASGGQARAELDRVPLAALGSLSEKRLRARSFDGTASGTLSASWEPETDDSVRIEADATLSTLDLRLAPGQYDADASDWQLGESTLRGIVSIDRSRSVHLEQCELRSQPLSANIAGEVRRVPGDWHLDLTGGVSSDPDLLLELAGGTVRQNVEIDGLAVQRVAVRGPVSALRNRTGAVDTTSDEARPAESPLQLEGDIGWTLLTAAGISSRDGLLTASWREGRVALDPVRMDVNGGRVVALPGFDIPARSFVVAGGPVVEDIQFTPEMCQSWLKYVSPLLADATSIDGRFSLVADEGQFPLSDMAAGQFRGRIVVHSGQVGPGPLAQQVLGNGRQMATLLKGELPLPRNDRGRGQGRWLVLSPQEVAFRFEEQRVHHERIEYTVDDVVLTTSGSVGLDESLELVVDVPVQDKWLGSRRALAGLKGEVLRVPVTGTLASPVIDPRPLADFNRRLAQKAAGGLLERLLDQ